jgi:predicted transcriptional regulator of viral defense system
LWKAIQVDIRRPLALLSTGMQSRDSNLAAFVDALQRQARYSFSRDEAAAAVTVSPATLTKGLQRLQNAGRIHRIRKGFYTIVPLEHADAGHIPTDWFIADLMRFLNIPYYVGALTAAAYHGAAHQQPQEFQVVTEGSRSPIRTGKLRIRFLRYEGISQVKTQPMKSFTGQFPVSSPEHTALDLVRFQKQIGGLDTVITVLVELGEKMSGPALLQAVRHEPVVAHAQRLGWLLARANCPTLAGALASWVDRRNPAVVPLNGSLRSRKGAIDRQWRLIINDQPEGEL